MSVLEWLFPNWSSPVGVAAIATSRLLVDAKLVWLVARADGRRSRIAILGAALTVLSAVSMVWVLRTGEGRLAVLLDLAFQGALVGLAGYATRRNPSAGRWPAFAAVALVAIVVLLPALVLYGGATVAP